MPTQQMTQESAPPRTDRPLRQVLVFLCVTYAIAVAIALALPHAGVTPGQHRRPSARVRNHHGVRRPPRPNVAIVSSAATMAYVTTETGVVTLLAGGLAGPLPCRRCTKSHWRSQSVGSASPWRPTVASGTLQRPSQGPRSHVSW